MTRPRDTGTNRRRINQVGGRASNLEKRIAGVPRISYGQVDGVAGSILDIGSDDWTADPGSFDGNWTITFDPPFAAPPTVLLSENETSTDPPNDIVLTSITEDTAGVATYKDDILSDDVGFNFIAIGT